MSNEVIEDFFSENAYAEDYSMNTIVAYRQDLVQCEAWLNDRKSTLMQASHQLLTEYLMYRNQQGLAFTSIARMIYTLRSFYRFLSRKSLRNDDPSLLLDKPRIWQLLPEVLTPEEIEVLLKTPISKKESHNVRNATMIQVLYGCGLRISELLGLKMEDIRIEEKMLLCYGKGKKERWLPFNDRVKEALIIWMERFRPLILRKNKSKFVFVGAKKEPLTRQHAWLILQKMATVAGIHKRIYPHIFRHSYATHILAGGGDLRIVQELLGHADISTTQKYTQIEQKKLSAKHKQFHPRA